MTESQVSTPAHAKVNLSLRILGSDTTGFHTIETVYCLLELADEVVVERTEKGVILEVEGPDLGPSDDNLAVRAARLVLEATGERFGVRIKLTKRIPVQAGLGGGSSDAAAVLEAVNRLAGKAVPRAELLQMSARLGSDVPFFYSGAGLALAWGRGERLFRLSPLPPRPLLLAVPGEGVSTAEAYQWWDQAYPEGVGRGAVVLEPDVFASWGSGARAGGNDFEPLLFARRSQVREAFEKLTSTHPLLCRLSGSGPALFAVYRSEQDRDDAAMQVGSRMARLIKTTTRQVS